MGADTARLHHIPAIRRLEALYAAPPAELHGELELAAARLIALAAEIRPHGPGAIDRAERFAEHADALRRQSMLLRDRLRSMQGGAPDAG